MRFALLLGLCLAKADGFTVIPTPTRTTASPIGRTMRPLPIPSTFSSSSPITTVSSSSLSVLPPNPFSSELLSDSTLVKAEFMNGMTHALLDFTALWGATAVVIRLAAVIGRLFIVAQDVVPGHEVLPDELAVQFFLLAVSCHALGSAILPKIQAHLAVPNLMTFRDRQAYRALFRPAGVSWSQYKELHLCSMDWVAVEPGQVILSEEDGSASDNNAVYWLYQGNVQVESNGTTMHNISSLKKSSNDNQTDNDDNEIAPTPAGLRLLGEKRLADILDHKRHFKKKEQPASSTRKVTAVAGSSGATLLRLNTTKLEKLLQHDPDLTSSVSRLAFQGMQDKLDALLLKEAA